MEYLRDQRRRPMLNIRCQFFWFCKCVSQGASGIVRVTSTGHSTSDVPVGNIYGAVQASYVCKKSHPYLQPLQMAHLFGSCVPLWAESGLIIFRL